MIQRKKELPVGISNFDKIIKKGFYYVDKTGLISELLNNTSQVTLITRPRRFGKSLNMKMLEAFFSPDTDKTIFDGLKISQQKEVCQEYMGKFPVLSISMSGIQGRTYAAARQMAVQMINQSSRRVLTSLSVKEEIDDYDIKLLQRLCSRDIEDDEVVTSYKVISEILARYYRKDVIILIDEYDVPLANAYEMEFYDEMLSLMRTFFEQTLKSNDNLNLAVLTGCMRISKESIFTGLNNINLESLSDKRFSEYFGFTDNEVKDLLDFYGLSNRYKSVKEWYDGYLFGNTKIYCPWDVISYCHDLLHDPQLPPRDYWINTSNNYVIRKLIEQGRNTLVKQEIEQLINGGTIEKQIRQNITYKEMYDSIDNIWSLLYMTGYLTNEKSTFSINVPLVIPNQEIRHIFIRQIMDFFEDNLKNDKANKQLFYEALISGNTASVELSMNCFLKDIISIRDNASVNKENFYHGILVGILGGKEGWELSSNKESGGGYYDLCLTSQDRSLAIILEIKYAKENELDSACDKALKQIELKHYAEPLQKYYTQILKYGIAFHKKECRVKLVR